VKHPVLVAFAVCWANVAAAGSPTPFVISDGESLAAGAAALAPFGLVTAQNATGDRIQVI
jgi:hypothetical protein